MRVVIMGAPGSGKGTQCAILKHTYRIPHISTGDILRGEVKSGTELGRKAGSFMKAGELVPDDLILAMVQSRLAQDDASPGWLMDGFPRTLEQARGLRELTKRIDHEVDCAVILNVDADLVAERLSGRANAERRADDTPDVVRNRILVFEERTRPVFDFFRKHYDVFEVDASRSIEDVTEALKVGLDRYDHS